MKIAQYPAFPPVAGHKKGTTTAEKSDPVLQEQENRSAKHVSYATFIDRSQQVQARLYSRNRSADQLMTQRAIDTYNINSTYSLFGGEGELVGVDLRA